MNRQRAAAEVIQRAVEWACRIDVAAPKAGNVHFGRSFDDLSATDFVVAGQAIAAPLARAGDDGVGNAVLAAVRSMEAAVGTNTHLGTILLLAPLAAADPPSPASTRAVLDRFTADDSGAVYAAIRRARPGGLGTADSMDIAAEPPPCLLDAMRAAANRDSVAAQYANGFRDVWQLVVPLLDEIPRYCRDGDWLSMLGAVVRAHLLVLAELGDTLIRRKCGHAASDEARRRAACVIDAARAVPHHEITRLREFRELDRWLRADGHRRNPGTTADLVTAGLYLIARQLLGEKPA